MPDPEPQNPPAPTPDPAPTPTPDPAPAAPPADDPGAWDQERAKRTILAQREAEARLKAENAELKAKADRLAVLEAEQMTEQQRKDQELADAKAEAAKGREQLQQAKLLIALAKPEHALADAKAAAELIKGVTFDDQGEPTNIAERVEALLGEHAILKAAPATPPTPTPGNANPGGGTGQAPAPSLTAEHLQAAQAAGKTPEEWVALQQVKTIEDWQRLQAAKSGS